MSDKISNTFQLRRRLTMDIAAMAGAESELALQDAALSIIDAYPSELVQSEVLKNLGTLDSQLRGGLGQVVALLPRSSIVPALRSIATDPSQPGQERLTAVQLLAQFLGESVPQALISNLNDANNVALQSLREAVDEGRLNRHVLLEYVTQMREAGDHIAPLVMDTMDQIAPENRPELYRLLALDDREYVAVDALRRLEQLARDPDRDDALRAVYTLRYMLSPNLTDHAVDALRRLQFDGRTYEPPMPDGWRALMTLPAFNGWQTIWFIRMPSTEQEVEPSDGVALFLNLNVHTGALSVTGNDRRGADSLPPVRTIGSVVPHDKGKVGSPQYLEAPFDFARWRVLEAIPAHWRLEGELPPEFRLYGDLLWEFKRPEAPSGYRRFFVVDAGFSAPTDFSSLDDLMSNEANREALVQWLEYNKQTLSLAHLSNVPESKLGRRHLAQALLSQLGEQPIGVEIAEALPDNLRSQTAWFECLGEPDVAAFSLACAAAMPVASLSQNPLMIRLIETILESHTGKAAGD